MPEYALDFEKPIAELDQRIENLRSKSAALGEDHSAEIRKLEDRRDKLMSRVFANLTRWQRVQLARHSKRPYALDYIERISPDFLELHGDRRFGDDKAVVAGLGSIEGMEVLWMGQQKGRNTRENLYRNFGMPRPEGYRKALRLMDLAEKFHRPVISLLDTPGAYPGVDAEERGQAEAIATNLARMASLKVPFLAVVIGEGASGGALGMGVGDRLIMLENTWFSVISPEGCASILWRDSSKAEQAADAMKVTAPDLMDLGICDRVIPEPLGGAHRNFAAACDALRDILVQDLRSLRDLPVETLLANRMAKYERMGAWEESAAPVDANTGS